MQDSAYILAWSPDGQQVAVGSGTGLRLYDAKTLTETATLEEAGCCGGIVMTGEILAAIGAKNASVSVWDISTRERLFTLNDDVINFQSLALSPDGKMLATGEQERIRLWEVPSGKALGTLTIEGFAANLAFTPDGSKLIAVTQWNAVVQEWDVAAQSLNRSFEIPKDVIRFTLSRDGSVMLVDYGTFGFELWDVASGQFQHTYEQAIGAPGSVNFSPDDKQVVVWGYNASSGSVAAVWDLETDARLRAFTTLSLNSGEWRYALFSPDGGTLALSDNCGNIYFYDIDTGDNVGLIFLPYKFKIPAKP